MKNSHILIVSCGHCKADIARYQKVGRGNLLNMHIDRVIEGSIDFSKENRVLICPDCNEQLATIVKLKKENEYAYRMIRAVYNTREETQ